MKVIGQFELSVTDLLPDTFPNDGILIPESDYGLAEIYINEDLKYKIYEIPMYGGEPIFYGKLISDPEEVIIIIRSFT